mgnify:CR=1 FL=1
MVLVWKCLVKFVFFHCILFANHKECDAQQPSIGVSWSFLTKSMTLKFAKKLSTFAICYKAIPEPEPTLPDLPNPTRGIDTSLALRV